MWNGVKLMDKFEKMLVNRIKEFASNSHVGNKYDPYVIGMSNALDLYRDYIEGNNMDERSFEEHNELEKMKEEIREVVKKMEKERDARDDYVIDTMKSEKMPVNENTIVGFDSVIEEGYNWDNYEKKKDDIEAIARVRQLVLNQKRPSSWERYQFTLEVLDEVLSRIKL